MQSRIPVSVGSSVGQIQEDSLDWEGSSKDTIQGTNIEAYKKLRQIEGLQITASGGISFEEEIITLKEITDAAILGKAIYSGVLDLQKAVQELVEYAIPKLMEES